MLVLLFSASHYVVLLFSASHYVVLLFSASHYVVLLCFTLCGPSLLHIMWSSASHYGGPSLLYISLGTLLGFLGLCFTLCGPSLLHIMLVLLFSASHYGGPSLLCFTLCWSFSSLLHIIVDLLSSSFLFEGRRTCIPQCAHTWV